MRALFLLGLLALTSCGPDPLTVARTWWPTEDDAKCRSYGLKPGDQGWADCRLRLEAIHQRQTQAYIEGVTRAMAPSAVVCNRFGATTICN
ncbi:MAG: hypothetical protein KGI71_04680 [Patescibacteria group bacterium]|nr:hypothetical protein [Patescibacteria group bacterium]